MKKGFFATHARRLAKKFSGRYIAVADDEIIAVGRSRLETYKKAVRKLSPHQTVGIYYFPKPEELLAALWTIHI